MHISPVVVHVATAVLAALRHAAAQPASEESTNPLSASELAASVVGWPVAESCVPEPASAIAPPEDASDGDEPAAPFAGAIEGSNRSKSYVHRRPPHATTKTTARADRWQKRLLSREGRLPISSHRTTKVRRIRDALELYGRVRRRAPAW